MTGLWRAPLMAPAYALLLTAVLALVGGAVVQNPTHIRFPDGSGPSNRPFPVTLLSERDHRLLDTAVVDVAGEATFVTPAEDARLCFLPDGDSPGCWLVPAGVKNLVIPATRATE